MHDVGPLKFSAVVDLNLATVISPLTESSIMRTTIRNNIMKVKVNLSLCMPWRHMGEWRSSSTFLTSALDGGKWSPSCLGYFTHEESTHYPLKRQMGGPQNKCRSFREEKIFCPYIESLFFGCLASSERNSTKTQYFHTQH